MAEVKKYVVVTESAEGKIELKRFLTEDEVHAHQAIHRIAGSTVHLAGKLAEEYVYEEPKVVSVSEIQTCKRRMTEAGPWERKEDMDRWEKRGDDRVCSFCGSIHPDDLLVIANQIIEGKDESVNTRLEMTDKGYKLYVRREHIKNASEGAIKFYTQHQPDDHRWLEVVNNAIMISNKKLNAMFTKGETH